MGWWMINIRIVDLKRIYYLHDPFYMGGRPSLARVRIFGKKIVGPVNVQIRKLTLGRFALGHLVLFE